MIGDHSPGANPKSHAHFSPGNLVVILLDPASFTPSFVQHWAWKFTKCNSHWGISCSATKVISAWLVGRIVGPESERRLRQTGLRRKP